MITSKFEVGSEVVSGNTFGPTRSVVKAIDLKWSDLTAREQRMHKIVCYWETAETLANETFVRSYTARNAKGCRWSVLSTKVFNHTHFATNEEMVMAYEARRAR